MGAFAKRYILAPVRGVARQGDLFARLVIADHIGAGAQRDLCQRCIGEIAGVPLGFAQDRTHAGKQGELAVVDIEHHLHAVGASLGDAVDLGVKSVIARVSLGAQKLVTENHILGGDRRAIRKLRFGAEGEFDP